MDGNRLQPSEPDLAPSDFHLIHFLQEFIGGKHLVTDDEVKEKVEEWLF